MQWSAGPDSTECIAILLNQGSWNHVMRLCIVRWISGCTSPPWIWTHVGHFEFAFQEAPFGHRECPIHPDLSLECCALVPRPSQRSSHPETFPQSHSTRKIYFIFRMFADAQYQMHKFHLLYVHTFEQSDSMVSEFHHSRIEGVQTTLPEGRSTFKRVCKGTCPPSG